MQRVTGVDCSTQSTKVVVYDAEDGHVVAAGTAPHPDTTEVSPSVWTDALEAATPPDASDSAAIGVAGQQHGMVLLDESNSVVRDALLWNDLRSAPQAADLTAELGGAEAWADAVGLVPMASFTVTKLRWVADSEPDVAARVRTVLLPHDWLTWQLSGQREFLTDRGDASGTGYWSSLTNGYRSDLAAIALRRDVAVPRVLAPDEVAGRTQRGALVSAGTGDNMAAALGLNLRPGDAVVSIGTSGTVFAVSETPSADPSGAVAGFADATGRFLPLVCTVNAARVLTTTAALLGVDLAQLDALALSARPGADGLVLLPYLDGERTPNLPEATGSLLGINRVNATAANVARAAVEGMLCGLAEGVEALRAQNVDIRRTFLIGGGARSVAVRELAPDVLGVPVIVARDHEYVARGAARQAAWVLSGDDEPPDWPVQIDTEHEPSTRAGEVLSQFRAGQESVGLDVNWYLPRDPLG
jgi:xylulokinase